MSPTRKSILIDLLRHGEPEGGDILRGRVNPPLTEKGWQQMRSATRLPQSAPAWTGILSSPLQRCQAFARAAARELNLEERLRVEDHWQEIDYGDWDGMQVAEWRRLAKDQFAAFQNDLSAFSPPNGENFLSFRDRVLAAWNGLQQMQDGSHVLLVTHGGVLRVILPMVLGMPPNRSSPLHIPFASFSRVRLDLSSASDRGETTPGEVGWHCNASLIFHNLGERQ